MRAQDYHGTAWLWIRCLVCCATVGVFCCVFFFFQAEDGIRDVAMTGVQTCALPICLRPGGGARPGHVRGAAPLPGRHPARRRERHARRGWRRAHGGAPRPCAAPELHGMSRGHTGAMSDAPRTLALGHLRAAPGERATGMVSVNLGSATVQIPVVIINGARPGPRVGATAGIHGAEYVSIAALRRVAMSLDPAEMPGSLVASLVSNPAAFAARSIYVDPLDGRNLNRTFPGDPAGGPTERLAAGLYPEIILPSERFLA